MSPVTLVSTDARLAADVRRLCEAVAVDLEVVTDRPEVLRSWRSAPVVLVDVAALGLVAGCPSTRRRGVVLLTDDTERLDVWRAAAQLGAEHVLGLPGDERALLDRLTGPADADTAALARTIGVVAGSGGAGASTLAASIGLAAARGGAATTLVDADPLGGGVDLLLGAEHLPGARWSELAGARGSLAADALDRMLPRTEGLRLLSCDRGLAADLVPDAVSAVLPTVRRTSDFVVVDLPRRFDAAAEIAAASCDLLLVVTTAWVRSAAAAAGVVASARGCCEVVHLVVRTEPRGRLRPADISRALDLPLAGTLTTDPGLCIAADGGGLAHALRRHRLIDVASTVLELARREAA